MIENHHYAITSSTTTERGEENSLNDAILNARRGEKWQLSPPPSPSWYGGRLSRRSSRYNILSRLEEVELINKYQAYSNLRDQIAEICRKHDECISVEAALQRLKVTVSNWRYRQTDRLCICVSLFFNSRIAEWKFCFWLVLLLLIQGHGKGRPQCVEAFGFEQHRAGRVGRVASRTFEMQWPG